MMINTKTGLRERAEMTSNTKHDKTQQTDSEQIEHVQQQIDESAQNAVTAQSLDDMLAGLDIKMACRIEQFISGYQCGFDWDVHAYFDCLLSDIAVRFPDVSYLTFLVAYRSVRRAQKAELREWREAAREAAQKQETRDEDILI